MKCWLDLINYVFGANHSAKINLILSFDFRQGRFGAMNCRNQKRREN